MVVDNNAPQGDTSAASSIFRKKFQDRNNQFHEQQRLQLEEFNAQQQKLLLQELKDKHHQVDKQDLHLQPQQDPPSNTVKDSNIGSSRGSDSNGDKYQAAILGTTKKNVAVTSDVTAKVASTTMNSKQASTEHTVDELDDSNDDWIGKILDDDQYKRQNELSDSDDDVTSVNKPDPVDGDISFGQLQTPQSFQKVQQLTPGSGIATDNLQMIMDPPHDIADYDEDHGNNNIEEEPQGDKDEEVQEPLQAQQPEAGNNNLKNHEEEPQEAKDDEVQNRPQEEYEVSTVCEDDDREVQEQQQEEQPVDSSTRETITEGAEKVRKLAAARFNDFDSGGLNKPANDDIFYDIFPNPMHTMCELKVRQIEADHLLQIAKIYAYRNYGITKLVWKGGRSGATRIYGCKKCDFEMHFVKVENTNKFILTKNETHEKWKNASFHRTTCQKHEISTCTTNAIKDTHIVLNHPDFLKSFKLFLGDDPIQAVHIKTDAICTLIENEFKTKYKHNVGFGVPTWSKIVNTMIDILHRKAALQYAFLPEFLLELIDKNDEVSVMLQTDEDGRFLRLFVGLPAALRVGELTVPYYVADCFHYKCSSYDGAMFAIVSKNGYGETVLLAIAIIPIEKTRHLGWCIECCVRHGMTFTFPLFTDQGPLLATASALFLHADSYYLLIHLNIRICVIHFIRGANHQNNIKEIEGTIANYVNQASRAFNQAEFFSIILQMVRSIVASINETALVNAIDIALYLLKVDPVHWCVFPNIPMFDQSAFDEQLSTVISDLYFVRNVSIHSKTHLQSADDDELHLLNVCWEMTESQIAALKNNGEKKILKPKDPIRGFWNWTTNIVEGASLATKSIGARYQPPHTSIRNVLKYAATQTRRLTENITKSQDEGNYLTKVGMRIKSDIGNQEPVKSIISIQNDLPEDTACADHGDNSRIKSTRCRLQGESSSWTTIVSYGHAFPPSIRSVCEIHMMMYDVNCPCKCVIHIFEKSKSFVSVGGVTVPDFAPEYPEFGRGLFKHVFPRCFQVDDAMHDESVRAQIIVPTTQDGGHKFFPVTPIDIYGNRVHSAPNLLVPPKFTAKYYLNDPRIMSTGERGYFNSRGPSRRMKGRSGHRESSGRFFCQYTSAMSARNAVHLTNPTEIISSHASPDVVVDDTNIRKSHCCRHCGKEGHTVNDCEAFHTFDQGIVCDDDPSMAQGHYLVYHTPNKVSTEYLPYASELAKPPTVELVAPSTSSVAGDGYDYLFLSRSLPGDVIDQALDQGRRPKEKSVRKKRNKDPLESRLRAFEIRTNHRPTSSLYPGVNMIELKGEFRRRKQFKTRFVRVGDLISKSKRVTLAEELFILRANEIENHNFNEAVDVVEITTAVCPPEPPPPLTEPDSYTSSDDNYIGNVTTCVLSRSTTFASSPSMYFVRDMIRLIPHLTECSFNTSPNHNNTGNNTGSRPFNQLTRDSEEGDDGNNNMGSRPFNQLSQDSQEGHDAIICTPMTQLENPLSTQEVRHNSDDEVIDVDGLSDCSDSDEHDDVEISMETIPLLHCIEGLKSYDVREHQCLILCNLSDKPPSFTFRRDFANSKSKNKSTIRIPLKDTFILFSADTNPPFFRFQYAKGTSKICTLFFSKVHLDSALQMVFNIGGDKFAGPLPTVTEKILQLLPSTCVTESKFSYEESSEQDVFIPANGKHKLLFIYPLIVSKLSLNDVTTGLSIYFTDFPFDKPLVEPLDAYKKSGRRGHLTSSSSSFNEVVSRVTPHMDHYHALDDTEWLMDTNVDFYMLWLTRNCTKTLDAYFMPRSIYDQIDLKGPKAVVNILKANKINLDAKLIFVPVCLSGHWTLIVIVHHTDIDDYLTRKQSRAKLDTSRSFPCFLYFDSLGFNSSNAKSIRTKLLSLLAAWREDQNLERGMVDIADNNNNNNNPFVGSPRKIMPLCVIKGVYS